ncbi:hypothetical protein [Candidatus Symbiopectobacterium sp. NZEC135]|uniref:hypothetical protein n=1 Tax=Candidatus Symbiopectobacterium sp. NZEC135 TaxID=2820471 RepID=UPI002225CD75|nr:hypothetical protein [Candidatus Symbiopectobacterium sp. NZEC135]MCW2477638.1 hypothetical protein [Candidatus Symbiopectobacterium sp. NZEC135]
MKHSIVSLFSGDIRTGRLFSISIAAAALLLPPLAFAESAAIKPLSSNLGQTCTQNAYGVDNALDALRCGSVHGSLRSL